MNPMLQILEIYHKNVLEFEKVCMLYKSILDKNLLGKFCFGEHCRTIYMVEITIDGKRWGTNRMIFQTKEEAEKEAKVLKLVYPFVSDIRVITRQEKEN